MTATTNQERIVRMETKVSTMKDDILEIKGDLKEIKAVLEEKFVTRGEFARYQAAQTVQKILIVIIASVFSSLVTFAITQLAGK